MRKKLNHVIQLPIDISYDFIIGGFCRDSISGMRSHPIKGFDIY